MGRKPKKQKKIRVHISIDRELWDDLKKDGVNKSRLFSVFAKIYLKRKARKKQKKK